MAKIDVGVVIAGKYVLRRLLGEGGMGQVWLATHTGLQQDFALKLLLPIADEREEEAIALRRFENEAQIAAALSRSTRHIVSVVDFGEDRGLFYLVMELLEGTTLEGLLQLGPLASDEVSRVVAQVAKALEVAHAQGVVHRDLKPANVFVARDPDGGIVVKLFDFGIARLSRRIVPPRTPGASASPTKLTVHGLVLGTPAYMSPEQAMGQTTDARTDVWALAVMAFEALAGDIPFAGPTVETTLTRICNCRPTPLRELLPTASRELDELFSKAFARDVDARFQSGSEFAEELARCLPANHSRAEVHVDRHATTMVAVEAQPPPRGRGRTSAFVVGVIMLASCALAAATMRSSAQGEPHVVGAAPPPLPSVPIVASSEAPATVTSPSATAAIQLPATRLERRHGATQPSASSKPIDRSAVF